MNSEVRYNPLSDFDFSALDNPEFMEDSVREEILAPLLKALGYNATGNNKIVRSRKLEHPFVSIGCKRKEIFLIPDYVLEIENTPKWILEAKAPNEKLLNSSHVEQAYSYAIHPEIRAKYYALSNGRDFVLFSVDEVKPILNINLCYLGTVWEELKALLSPKTLEKNKQRKLAKDLGLHIKRLGFNSNIEMFFYDLPLDHIAKLENDLYTTSLSITIDDNNYCVSFDFDHKTAMQLEGKIPHNALGLLLRPLTDAIRKIEFENRIVRINVKCVLSGELVENDDEIFLPLRLHNIF